MTRNFTILIGTWTVHPFPCLGKGIDYINFIDKKERPYQPHLQYNRAAMDAPLPVLPNSNPYAFPHPTMQCPNQNY
jgi:hypothetical protein